LFLFLEDATLEAPAAGGLGFAGYMLYALCSTAQLAEGTPHPTPTPPHPPTHAHTRPAAAGLGPTPLAVPHSLPRYHPLLGHTSMQWPLKGVTNVSSALLLYVNCSLGLDLSPPEHGV
jgi:hypothetical protein